VGGQVPVAVASPSAGRGREPSLRSSDSSGQLPQNRPELAAIVAEALSDPIVGALDGTIHTWNPGAERLFGYAAEEVIGMPVSILYPPDRLGELEEIMRCLARGEAVEQFDTVRRRKDGTDVQVSLSLSPVRSESGELVGAAIVHDIGDRKRLDSFQRFLVEASRLLAVGLDYRETLSRVAHLTLSDLADWCLVEVPDPTTGSLSQVAAAHRDPAKAALARDLRRRYPPNAERPDISFRVLTTGMAELIPDVSDALLKNIAQSADHLRMLRELDPRSLVVVPLRVGERTLGTIVLGRTQPGRPFSSDDLELAEDLGRRAAVAIDNSNLHRSEQEARHRAEEAVMRISGLQAVTAALLQALTPRAVAEVFVRHGAAAVGASGGFVRLLADDGRTLRLAATVGYSERFNDSYKSLPLTSALPGAQVFRTDGERYFESATAAEAASPEFAREQAATGHEAIAFVPLHLGDRPIGLMAMSFLNPRPFDDDDRELLRTLASQCSQALERARLYEAERHARATAELAIEQTTRLQSLAADLAEALTAEQVAEVVVNQGMASLHADAGAFHLLANDGKTLEVIYQQASVAGLTDDGRHRFSVNPKSPSNDALHRLEPLFIESEEEFRESYAYVSGTRAALQPRTGVHIPLVAFGRAIGVLFLGFTSPRRFADSERSFVLALGRQCAQALKRAQLYGAELEGRTRLSRLVERLHEGVVSVDRRGRVEFASSPAKRMLSSAALEEGRPVPEEWLGFPLQSFVARLFEAAVRPVEAQVASQDGSRVFEVTGIPAARTDVALLVITDVSERERRRRVEREFIDNAAHELRTPLTAITSAVERLKAGAREVPEKRDRFLAHIERESSRLTRLASSLLVLARAQTRDEDPRREEIRLAGLIDDSVRELELERGVDLVLDCPPDLVARSNRDLLEHALLNLVSNAAHHTRRGRICVRAAVRDESTMIEISDTGSGIPRDEQDRLFDRFYRGSGERGGTGFGLGLPITKEAIEALGGRVEIDSVLGKGTTARIILPSVGGLTPV
jgi:PAS domain S-box-containing protein